jgi:molybdate transport system substrate-binding protein
VQSDIKVLSTTAMKTTLDELVPAFERDSPYTLSFDYAPSAQIARRVADGESGDTAIALDQLTAAGRIVAGSGIDLARSEIGMAVRKGAPRPDISDVEGFKRALLDAKSIAMSHPNGGGQSGAHLQKVFERLGIADALKAKLLYGTGGPAGLIGFFLLRGEADIGLQQMPELMAVPGIDILGAVPREVQAVTIFSVGTLATTTNIDAGKAFARFLQTPIAATVLQAKGMKPA